MNEDKFLTIVRNQILVDVQGNDLLFQIFTSNILQRNASDEAPFLEFIQRVCAGTAEDGCQIGMKAGCGGFGIRNFLTLFLSIEI
jgi:4-hydroxyphenylpyruvate dioxygenase-like putative hemolysin